MLTLDILRLLYYSQETTQLVDNLNAVENNFQIARNFDQPNRRVVIKMANIETGSDFDVTMNNVIFRLQIKRDYPYRLPVPCQSSSDLQTLLQSTIL